MATSVSSGVRAVQAGLVVNAALAAIKLAAGIIGNTYALVADAIESGADVFASIIVWSGLTIAAQPADDDHPYGHGKAEALAAAEIGRASCRERGQIEASDAAEIAGVG